MEQAGRFQRNQELRRDGKVVTSLGVDVVTGLAVLIYDFPGEPLLKQGFQDVNGLPAVLASWVQDDEGTLVTAYPSDATLVAPGESVVDDQFVLQALTILRDAAKRGLAHGDLGAGRFLWSGRRVYLEGYGVPWKPGLPRPAAAAVSTGAAAVNPALAAALTADLQSAVKALLTLGAQGISSEVAAALRGATSGKSGADAASLQGVVRRLAGGAVTVPSAGFVDIVLPVSKTGGAGGKSNLDLDALDFTPVAPSAARGLSHDPNEVVGDAGAAPRGSAPRTDLRVEQGETPPPRVTPPRPQQTPAEALSDPDPITLHSDPGSGTLKTTPVSGSAADSGFVKHLPPGATYRSGSLDETIRPAPIRIDDRHDGQARRKAWRGPGLLILLLLVVALGSFLALRAQRNSDLAQVGGSSVRHLVDVRVSPSNLPPVSLVVDRSPDGSSYSPGTIIGSVPRRVSFDANGTWTVHAQFQGRSSAQVTLRVPEDTVITLAFEEQPAAP